jgi:ABC-type sugar transport system ATPase subunit
MLLQQGYGVTMLYATNDQTEAMALADSILVLDAGVVRQIGAPLDLYHRPADRFVAGFVGTPSMSFVNGSVERDGSGFLLTLFGRRWRAWDPGLDAVIGRPLVIGLRSEYVELVDSGGPRGTVVSHEYAGDFGWCAVRIGGDEVLVRIEGTLPPDGAEVMVGFTAFHVFDEAGRAIAHVKLPGPAQAV